jgi:hypothetical protein
LYLPLRLLQTKGQETVRQGWGNWLNTELRFGSAVFNTHLTVAACAECGFAAGKRDGAVPVARRRIESWISGAMLNRKWHPKGAADAWPSFLSGYTRSGSIVLVFGVHGVRHDIFVPIMAASVSGM